MKKALLLKKLKQKQAQKRKFWTRPGRTDAWWTSLKSRSMVPPEWKENFRMLKESFYILAEKLRPYIKRQNTNFRVAVSVDKQLALTLYYLSDEGRLRNAFGLSHSCVSIIIRRVTCAIAIHLRPEFIQFPITKESVNDYVINFYCSFSTPQCLGAIDGTHIEIKQPSFTPLTLSIARNML